MIRASSLVVLAAFAAAPAAAAPIVAGTTVIPSIAIQDITLLPGTDFNPMPYAIVLNDLFGVGQLVLNRGPQVGSTIPVPSLSGIYYGSHPLLGDFVFGTVPPLTAADFSGTISNVVQDPNDPGFASGSPSSFRSGDAVLGGASFGFAFLSGPAVGITLFTDPAVPFEFAATFNGLPPTSDTLLQNSGTDVLNVRFNGTVVATSSDRRILLLAVPEPGTLAVVGAIGLGGLVARRSRRTGSQLSEPCPVSA